MEKLALNVQTTRSRCIEETRAAFDIQLNIYICVARSQAGTEFRSYNRRDLLWFYEFFFLRTRQGFRLLWFLPSVHTTFVLEKAASVLSSRVKKYRNKTQTTTNVVWWWP